MLRLRKLPKHYNITYYKTPDPLITCKTNLTVIMANVKRQLTIKIPNKLYDNKDITPETLLYKELDVFVFNTKDTVIKVSVNLPALFYDNIELFKNNICPNCKNYVICNFKKGFVNINQCKLANILTLKPIDKLIKELKK